jgi:cell division septum initiation protein DivIVA
MATSGKKLGTLSPDPKHQFGAQEEDGAGERLRQAGEDARDEVRRQAERASGRAESLKEEARQRASRLLDDAKERARPSTRARKASRRTLVTFAHALRASAGTEHMGA